MVIWEEDFEQPEVVPLEPLDDRSAVAGSNLSLSMTTRDSLTDDSNSTSTEDLEAVLVAFNDVLGVGITGIVCLFGVAGNVLTFVVLLRTFGRSPMFYVLRMLSISDGLFLLSVFLLQTIVNIYPHTGILSTCFHYRGHVQYYIWPWMMTTQMTTVWLTVLVSCERYVAICHPLKAIYVCTIGKVRMSVIAIVVASVLFNVPRYFEFTTEYDAPMIKSDIGTDFVYRYMYTCVLYAIALFLLPLMLLLVLNFLLVAALRRGKREWRHLQFRQRHEQNLTVIPLTIVLVFFLCGTPSLIVNIADSVSPDLNMNLSFLAFMICANFLVVVNSASNIVIYFLLGRKFRSRVAEMIRCKCCYRNNVVTLDYELTERPEMTDLSATDAVCGRSRIR